MAQSYAMCGVNGGWAAWAKHCPNFSVDSVLSDFSDTHLGCPALGDKMIESAFDHDAIDGNFHLTAGESCRERMQ